MKITRSIVVVVIAAGLALSVVPDARALPHIGHSKHLLMKDVSYQGTARLEVTSPSFKDAAHIPYENTQYRGNIFPGLSWSEGPEGTHSYVVIFQGFETAGQHSGSTVIALTAFNIPASVTKLDVGMTTLPDGAIFGPNVRGLNKPYAGPHVKTPGEHHYYIQVFALDSLLPPDQKMTYEHLASAMSGHVLALGVLHGFSDKDPQAKDN